MKFALRSVLSRCSQGLTRVASLGAANVTRKSFFGVQNRPLYTTTPLSSAPDDAKWTLSSPAEDPSSPCVRRLWSTVVSAEDPPLPRAENRVGARIAKNLSQLVGGAQGIEAPSVLLVGAGGLGRELLAHYGPFLQGVVDPFPSAFVQEFCRSKAIPLYAAIGDLPEDAKFDGAHVAVPDRFLLGATHDLLNGAVVAGAVVVEKPVTVATGAARDADVDGLLALAKGKGVALLTGLQRPVDDDLAALIDVAAFYRRQGLVPERIEFFDSDKGVDEEALQACLRANLNIPLAVQSGCHGLSFGLKLLQALGAEEGASLLEYGSCAIDKAPFEGGEAERMYHADFTARVEGKAVQLRFTNRRDGEHYTTRVALHYPAAQGQLHLEIDRYESYKDGYFGAYENNAKQLVCTLMLKKGNFAGPETEAAAEDAASISATLVTMEELKFVLDRAECVK